MEDITKVKLFAQIIIDFSENRKQIMFVLQSIRISPEHEQLLKS